MGEAGTSGAEGGGGIPDALLQPERNLTGRGRFL